MNGQLLIVGGPEQGKTFAVRNGQKVVLGRGQAADIQLNDPHMSRIHCNFSIEDGRALLSDAGSSGGTFVGDKKVDSIELQIGTVFRVGGSEIKFQAESTPEGATLRVGAVNASPLNLAPLKDLVGQTFHKYELRSVIAEGSNSTIFKAFDTEKERTVAFKVLTPDFAQSDEQKERFVRAMKAMMPIRHPNIVRILYAGKTGPYCWTAMEYIDGESLEKVIERIGIRGMLDWPYAFRAAVHICRALDESYNQKIVHRNLTPANIMRRHEDKVCLLSDLMLAKATEGALSKQVTQAGQIIGNLSYVAPECTMGDQPVDHRSDLYGLGATLYALVTGRPPFVSKSMPELVKMIRSDSPAKPKEFQLAIHDGFQDVIMELLQKRPEDRYQKPSDLLRDLERVAKFTGQSID